MSRDIKILTDKDHVRNRPEMYVGSVHPDDTKVPLLNSDNLIEYQPLEINEGMYKILDEVIDNAYDEAKRGTVDMTTIKVELDTSENRITVTDNGSGFKDAHKKHPDSDISNMETAVSILRAGSNFDNTDEETLIGMHGMGVSITNVLSKEFFIETREKGSKWIVSQTWHEFESQGKLKKSKKPKNDHGTTISFIPTTETFGNSTYNPDYMQSMLTLKQVVINYDDKITNLKIEFWVNGKKQEINPNIFPEDSVMVESKIGLVAIMPQFKHSNSTAFINSSIASGIHQTILKQQLSEVNKYDYAYRYFDTFIILNLPPNLARFAGQNKNRLATSRKDLEPYLDKYFGKRLKKHYKKSDLKEDVDDLIQEALNKKNLKKIKKKKRSVSKIKISDKYFPPSNSRGNRDILISEGLSASGSILQARDSSTQGVYALKGKPKNVKDIEQLKNQEFIELMSILGLDPAKKKQKPKFKRIIIASDQDYDGFHIQSLLINFFYRWFPDIIKSGYLYIFNLPIGICRLKSTTKYFYSVPEFEDYIEHTGYSIQSTKYTKGLGSYSPNEWDYIMENMNLIQVNIDQLSSSAMNLAFGNDSSWRKLFLMNKININEIPSL